MPYRQSIYLKPKEEWERILLEANIYELKLPKNVDHIPAGKQLEWKSREPDDDEDSYYRRDESANIMEVVAVWSNPKNTIKVIVAGKDKKVTIFSREHQGEGWTGLDMPDRYSDQGRSDIFDRIVKGSYIVTHARYYRSAEDCIGFITNEKTILGGAKKIIEILYNMFRLRSENNEFKWQNENQVKSYGTVSLNEVLHQKFIFDETLRKFKWTKRKERWDLWNSVKANLSIKRLKGRMVIRAKALDGKTYYCDYPIVEKEEEKDAGWGESTVRTMDYWLPFVYRKPGDSFLTKPKAVQSIELIQRLTRVFRKLPEHNIIFGVNRRQVKLERKRSQNDSRINYLDGNLVSWGDCVEKMNQYFFRGTPITPTAPPKPVSTANQTNQPKRKVLSEAAKKLIEEGLNGTMKDLEGDFPFHLNIVYKEHERKWYLEMAGKEFYVKGGQTALKKIQSAITGTALVDHSKYGWNRYHTMMIKDRIAELVGDKSALWIILHVKRMGAMMKTIAGE